MGCEIEPAELQELAVVAEPAEVAGFGKYSQGIDGSDASYLPQPAVVGMILQPRAGTGEKWPGHSIELRGDALRCRSPTRATPQGVAYCLFMFRLQSVCWNTFTLETCGPALAPEHPSSPPRVCYATEFTSTAMLGWQQDHAVDWHYIAPAKPMHDGLAESFIGRLRDEYTLSHRYLAHLRQRGCLILR